MKPRLITRMLAHFSALALAVFVYLYPSGNDIKFHVASDTNWAIYWTTDFITFEFLGQTDVPEDGLWREYGLTDVGTLKHFPHGFYVFVEFRNDR